MIVRERRMLTISFGHKYVLGDQTFLYITMSRGIPCVLYVIGNKFLGVSTSMYMHGTISNLSDTQNGLRSYYQFIDLIYNA